METLTGLFSTFLGIGKTAYEYPWISLAILIAVVLGIFVVLADGAVQEARHAVWRIISLYFSTPFEILRRILRVFRTHVEREERYKGTFEFVTFRWTRFLYLGILLGAIAILAIGTAGSIIALYPKVELDARSEITKQIEETTAAKQKAQKLLDDSAQPGFKDRLKTERSAAEQAFEKTQSAYNAVIEEDSKTNGFSGGAVTAAGQANTLDELKELGKNVEEGVKSCPGPNYSGFTEDQCGAFAKLIKELIAKREAILNAWKDLQEKTDAERNTQRVINEATATVKESTEKLVTLNTDLENASKYFSDWLPRHLTAFSLLLLQTLAIFFAFVWGATIVADVLSWVVMMMLSLEVMLSSDKRKTDDLES